MGLKLVFIGLLTLNLVACASPRERAYRAAINDYKHKNAVVADFARANVKQLVSASKSFRSLIGRWPQKLGDLAEFALGNGVPLDPLAFNDVTFATLADGSLQVRYDVNCSRFDDAQHSFTQTGSENVKAK